MDVAIIDYYANHGASFLHRAGALSKILFAVFVIASVVLTSDFYWLSGIYLILLSVCLWSRLPFLKIVTLAAYPAIFALLFVFASWNGDWSRAGVIMLKALSASMTMVIVIVTTPYPEIFNSLKPFLPGVVADSLFVTYRSLFILLGLTDGLMKGLRVRGGIKKWNFVGNVKNFSSGIGLLLVRGFDMSEKFYGVMRVRGYSGGISAGRGYRITQDDILILLSGAVVLAASIAIHSYGSRDFVIYAPVMSVIMLVISVVYIIQSEL